IPADQCGLQLSGAALGPYLPSLFPLSGTLQPAADLPARRPAPGGLRAAAGQPADGAVGSAHPARECRDPGPAHPAVAPAAPADTLLRRLPVAGAGSQ